MKKVILLVVFVSAILSGCGKDKTMVENDTTVKGIETETILTETIEVENIEVETIIH